VPPRAPMGRAPTMPPAASKSTLGTASTAASSPADEVIEIPAEEMDLAQLAELAKKVIEPGTK